MGAVIDISSTLLSFVIWRLLSLADQWFSALLEQSQYKERIMLCLYLLILIAVVAYRVRQSNKEAAGKTW